MQQTQEEQHKEQDSRLLRLEQLLDQAPYGDDRRHTSHNEVARGLHVGDIHSVADAALMAGVALVISVFHPSPDDRDWVKQHVARTGAAHLLIEARDVNEACLFQWFDRVFDLVHHTLGKREQQQQQVLIHCMAGHSRSATLAASYLIRKEQKSAEAVLRDMLERRPCVGPNTGFLKQLLRWEDRWGGQGE